MCHSGCRRHKETLFSCGPSVHCRAKQGRGGLQSDCLGSSLDFETAIQMHICWFELCPFKTVGKRHWMTLKPDWIYDCSKESRIFSFCGQPAISVHQWTDECLLFSNNTVMTWLSSCFSFSIYHEGLQSLVLYVLDTLVLVCVCEREEQRARGVVLWVWKVILCHCTFWYHQKRLLTHKYLTEQTLIETSLSPLPL